MKRCLDCQPGMPCAWCSRKGTHRNLRRNSSWPFMLVLGLLLTACGGISGSGGGLVQRCPAVVPAAPVCGQDWQFERSAYPDTPAPIEALQERYAAALALIEDADAAIKACRARDQVWLGSWEDCGED